MVFNIHKKSALLVDFDNVIGMTGGDLAVRIPSWLAWLEAGKFDPANIRRKFLTKRVYWNGMNERYRPAFEAAGFEAFACRAIARDKKSSADIVMTLDALDVANELSGLAEVVLLTSDTDFVPVVNRLQSREIAVVALGNEENTTAAVYRDYADLMILRRDLTGAFAYSPNHRGWLGRIKPTPAFAPTGLSTMRNSTRAPIRSSAAVAQTTGTHASREQPSATTPVTRDRVDQAADRLVLASIGALGAPLSRQSACRALQDIPGMATSGRDPWLGCGSYKALLRAVVSRRPNELRLHSYQNGGLAIAYSGK